MSGLPRLSSPIRQHLFVWRCHVQICKGCFGRWGGGNHDLIQRSKTRYINMLWNMWSITRHKRSYGHPLHPDLTPDVLTWGLPLGTVSSGKGTEVVSAYPFLTIIQFSIFQRMSSYFSTYKHYQTETRHP